MADLQTALRSRVVAAVGHSRVYWTHVPQGKSLPYVRMQTVSDDRPADLDDYEAARETRVQVDCFAEDYGTARGMAEIIIDGTNAPTTVDGVILGRTKAEGPRDFGEDIATTFVHQLSLDLLIWHRMA